MSDGSLSQDEIDALLMGNDSLGGMDFSSPGPGGSGGPGASELDALKKIFAKVVGNLSSTLSGVMSTPVRISAPSVESLSRDELMSTLTDEVVEVKMDFNRGISGGHAFVFTPDNAVKIAGPMIGQNDVELDGTAISAVGEAVSQLTGSEVTVIGDSVNTNIMTISPESQKIAKGLISAGGDYLVKVSYPVNIEGQGSLEMIEIFESSVASELAGLLGGASSGASADPMAGMSQNAGGMGMGMGMGQQAPNPGMQQMGNQMGGMGMGQPMMGNQMGGMGMGQQMMGNQMGGMGMGQQMMGNPYMMNQTPPPNVSGVQFSEFGVNISPSEQRNIGLLMDVSMELTVELGRTKWQIKDILGIGEGTIIELDKLAGEPVDILVNNNLIAKGEVVVIDENFGVRVTDIVSNIG